MNKLFTYFIALLTFISFSGCDNSDEENLHLININLIEGKWTITKTTFEVSQDGVKISGYEDEPNATISFYGGKAAILGDNDTYTYTINTGAVNEKDYLTLVEKDGETSVFELTELTLENMRWDRDEITKDHNGKPQREKETTVFKKIEE